MICMTNATNGDMNMDKSSLTYHAALFYAKHCGMRGTDKQIEKILKNTAGQIVRMATERGFNLELNRRCFPQTENKGA